MKLVGILIFIGILVLMFGIAVYLAQGEKSKNRPYGSWSNVLGPQFRGSAFDVGENLKEEFGEGEHQKRSGSKVRHPKKKQ